MTIRTLTLSFAAMAAISVSACAPAGKNAATGVGAAATAPSLASGEIIDIASGARLEGASALADRLARADVVILGEKHDNPEHHRAQAEITQRIASRNTPAALVFEMIPPEAEPEMAELRGRGAAGETFGPLIGWDAWGWPDWAYYAPILDAAPETPVLGAAVPREQVIAAMQASAGTVFADELGGDAGSLGLDKQLPPDIQAAMEQEQIAAHCDALPAEMAPPMVEAQRLRDAAFAAAVLRGRAVGEGPVILITGSGHGRTDRAVPAYLRAAEPDLDVVSLAFVELSPDPTENALGERPFDYLWFTEAFDRGDPCEAFRAAHSG